MHAKTRMKGGSYEEAMALVGAGSAVGGIHSNYYVRSREWKSCCRLVSYHASQDGWNTVGLGR
jgi:hypothetical protein